MVATDTEGGIGPVSDGGGPPGGAPGGHRTRRSRWRHLLGWASWPFFVWRPHPGVGTSHPGAIRSIVHTGYALSLLALATDLVLWKVFFLPGALLFLLAHLVWISAIGSGLLLQSGFLQHLDGRPLERLGWANVLTILRAAFLPLLLYLLSLKRWPAGLILYAALGLTDIIDGAVARRRHEESKLGFILDPFVDILFHLGVLLSLAASGVLSGLTGTLVATRYLLLLVGCAVLYVAKGEIWIQPTPFGKVTGLVIAVLTSALLLALGLERASPGLRRGIDAGLSIVFAAAILHVLLIGRVNFRRPAAGSTLIYRRGWGLLLGRRAHRANEERERGGP